MEELEKDYFVKALNSPYKENGRRVSSICPNCGGGSKHEYTFNLYFANNDYFVKCFRENNCGYNSSLKGFLKEHNDSLYGEYISKKYPKNSLVDEVEDDVFKNLAHTKIEFVGRTPLSRESIKNEIIEEPNYIDENDKFFDYLLPLNEEALSYLKKRGITKEEFPYIEDWKVVGYNEDTFYFNNKAFYPFYSIIVPFKNKNKWYGFQTISYREGTKIVFLQEGNSSWKSWNYFNYNSTNKDVYFAESIFDAMSSGFNLNEIESMMGVTTEKKSKNTIFLLDNQNHDMASLLKTLEYLKNGYRCVFWNEELLQNTIMKHFDKKHTIKDTNDLKKLGVPSNIIKMYLKKCIMQPFSNEKEELEFVLKHNKLLKTVEVSRHKYESASNNEEELINLLNIS